jgi:phage terminase Nu1 subunit (DNA packaging protein)
LRIRNFVEFVEVFELSTEDELLNRDDDVSHVRKKSAQSRHVTLSQLASLIDRDRNTISKYVEQGCPVVERADRATGKAWVLDMAEIVRWLERRAAESAVEKIGGSSDVVSEAEGKRRRAVAVAIIAEAEAAETLHQLARWQVVLDRVTSDYAELRSRLSAIPDAVAGRVERRIRATVRGIVDEQIATALNSLKTDTSLRHRAGGAGNDSHPTE